MLSRLQQAFARKRPLSIPPGGFVDIHAHVIPGFDEGPQDWDTAIRMVENAAAAGTSLLVATPHGDHRARWHNVDALREATERLQTHLVEWGSSLQIVLGMENPLDLGLTERLAKGEALPINGTRNVLVEFPYIQLPLYWEDVLYRLQLDGWQPIIVHPERQTEIQKNLPLLASAVDRGALVQVTAGSLTARFGSEVRHAAESMLKHGIVHFLASDTHGPEGARSPGLSEGYEAASAIVGSEKARALLCQDPRRIVLG